MSLPELLRRHQYNYQQDPESEKEILSEIATKSHETNSFLLKRFSIMSLLAIVFFLCQTKPDDTVKAFGFQFSNSPLTLLTISTFYAYQLMLWSFTALDDIHLTYVLHNKGKITGAVGDEHLLHFEKFPLSIFCTEQVIQAHFKELKCLNCICWKINGLLARLTYIVLYGLGLYLPVNSLFNSQSFHLLYLILVPAVLILLIASTVNLVRARAIQKQWDS